jgi:hypothetical protein
MMDALFNIVQSLAAAEFFIESTLLVKKVESLPSSPDHMN